jgi:hypothetical protein
LLSKPFLLPLLLIVAILAVMGQGRREADSAGSAAPADNPALERMLALLLNNEQALRDIPFRTVIRAATGHRVLPVRPEQEVDGRIIDAVCAAMDRVLVRLNRPGSPTSEESRINEVSAHFERALRAELDARESFSCAIPTNAEGEEQRTGYPDLRLLHKPSGRITYLDPKLLARGSLGSTFRTFYYSPKRRTNKVLEDAHHLLIGIEHDGKTGRWQFVRYHLVDLHGFRVRLKAEFQAGNDDLYRPDLLLRSSRHR